jgi:hypothetical protein
MVLSPALLDARLQGLERLLLRSLDHGVGQQPLLIVNIDNQFADHHTLREGQDLIISFEVRVDKNARREALMHRANW